MICEKHSLYEDRDDVFLTTYLWEPSPELLAGEKRPLVLVCPGGGYLNCSDREAEPVALRFAGMGYHAAVLRYSTYGERRDDFARLATDDYLKPHILYPVQMRELGIAMLLLKRRAAEWRIDADRVAICGFSAGAHNCAMYAVNWNRPVLTDALKANPEELHPAAVILGYPVVDFGITEGVCDADRPLYADMYKAFIGAAEPSEAQFAQIDAARQVTADTPPMFIWSTAADATVPAMNSLNLASALSKHGVPFELHIFEEGLHGMGLCDQASAGVTQHMDAAAAKWPELAGSWLAKRFVLDVPKGE